MRGTETARQNKQEREREGTRERESERERGSSRQTGVAMATSGDSGEICRHRIQFGMSMTFPTRSPAALTSLPAEASFHCLSIACLLFIVFAFNGFDLGIPTP